MNQLWLMIARGKLFNSLFVNLVIFVCRQIDGELNFSLVFKRTECLMSVYGWPCLTEMGSRDEWVYNWRKQMISRWLLRMQSGCGENSEIWRRSSYWGTNWCSSVERDQEHQLYAFWVIWRLNWWCEHQPWPTLNGNEKWRRSWCGVCDECSETVTPFLDEERIWHEMWSIVIAMQQWRNYRPRAAPQCGGPRRDGGPKFQN